MTPGGSWWRRAARRLPVGPGRRWGWDDVGIVVTGVVALGLQWWLLLSGVPA